MKYLLIVTVASVFTLFTAGCSKEMATSAEQSSQSFTLSPADNQTGVSTSSSVVLSLDKKIDPGTVRTNFHVISESSFDDPQMPGHSMMNHMTMMSAMDDESVMEYMDSVHSLSGTFSWNSDSTVCTFDPDSMFAAGTQYMIHFDQPMVNMMEEEMGPMNGMMGTNGSAYRTGMAFQFTTK